MQANSEIIPGWTLQYREMSADIFNMSLRDRYGRIASATETGFENALHKVEEYAYQIEMSINNYPAKFLFNYFLLKLGSCVTKKGESSAYGTWGIETNAKQLVYEGREDLILEKTYLEDLGEWNINTILSMKELTYLKSLEVISFMKQ